MRRSGSHGFRVTRCSDKGLFTPSQIYFAYHLGLIHSSTDLGPIDLPASRLGVLFVYYGKAVGQRRRCILFI
jgi:hypothetical protein